jgi:hypothetical protein
MAIKLRFRVVLPLAQLAMAVGLIWISRFEHGPRGAEYWAPKAWLFCRALNAPAILFSATESVLIGANETDWLPEFARNWDFGDAAFLVGVVVVWYLVGLALDKKRMPNTPKRSLPTVVLSNALFFLLGGLLVFAGWKDFTNPITEFARSCSVLILLWAAALLSGAGRSVAVSLFRLRRSRSVG